MAAIAVYRIGRSSAADINIDDDSVSRAHAELVLTSGGAYYLMDCRSTSGTYVSRNGRWKPVAQDFIHPSDSLLLGRHRTSIRRLLSMIVRGGRLEKGKKDDGLPEGPVRRNVDTGEIIGEGG